MRLCARALGVLAALTALVPLAALAPPAASAAECANEAIRIEQHATSLPECRAWEVVSAHKEGGQVFFTGEMGGPSLEGMTTPAANGESFAYISFMAWGEDPNPVADSYLARRTPSGWESKPISPPPSDPHPIIVESAIAQDATSNLSHMIFSLVEFGVTPQEAEEAKIDPFTGQVEYRQGVYVREPDGSFVWKSRGNGSETTPVVGNYEVRPKYAGRSADMSHVLFETSQKLVPAAAGLEKGQALYERYNGHTELVDVNNEGKLLNACGAAIGGALPSSGAPNKENAVSEDGSHVYFTAPDVHISYEALASCKEPGQVYLRYDGKTIDISASQRSVEDPEGTKPASFEGATANGEIAFFRSAQALTNDAEPVYGTYSNYLYEYDVATGKLHLLTPPLPSGASPNVSNVVAFSKDGKEVFFTGYHEVEGKEVLELAMYAEGHDTTIADIPATASNWVIHPADSLPVKLSADGLHLAFAAKEKLTSFENAGMEEIYLYDVTTKEITCVSCNYNGHVPIGNASFTEDTAAAISGQVLPEAVDITANGEKVFFETKDNLVPADENEAMDVYEWDKGTLSLLSGGKSEYNSLLVGSAAEGRDVFFVTANSLAPQDTDNGAYDVYDARVGGGFAAPPAAAVCTSGCEQAAALVPALLSPGSALIGANGNIHNAKKHVKKRAKGHGRHKKHKALCRRARRHGRNARRHGRNARRHGRNARRHLRRCRAQRRRAHGSRAGHRHKHRRHRHAHKSSRRSAHAHKGRGSRATGHRNAPARGR